MQATRRKKNVWTAAKLTFGMVFALLWFTACYLLYQSGLVRDEFGLSGAGPFYAGGGLWLAMLLAFAMAAVLAVSIGVRVYNPWRRRAVVGALASAGVLVAVYAVPTLLMCAAYHTQVSGGVF